MAVAAGFGVLTVLSLLHAPSAGAVPVRSGCAQVDVITARGQYEPAGTSGYVLGPMATALVNRLPQTVVVYPLPFDAGADLIAGANGGIRALTDHLTQMRALCPATRFVVLGFSLGALVAGETFAPATRYPGITTVALPTSIDPKVAAVVLFGDGRFHAGAPQAYGSFRGGVNGQFPRPANAFARFGDHVRNVCNQADPVCQALPAGETSTQAHQDYVKYTDALVGYVSYQLSVTP